MARHLAYDITITVCEPRDFTFSRSFTGTLTGTDALDALKSVATAVARTLDELQSARSTLHSVSEPAETRTP